MAKLYSRGLQTMHDFNKVIPATLESNDPDDELSALIAFPYVLAMDAVGYPIALLMHGLHKLGSSIKSKMRGDAKMSHQPAGYNQNDESNYDFQLSSTAAINNLLAANINPPTIMSYAYMDTGPSTPSINFVPTTYPNSFFATSFATNQLPLSHEPPTYIPGINYTR